MFKTILHEHEIMRIKNIYKYEKDQRIHLLSLCLQKIMINEIFSIDYQDIIIKKNEWGKPYFENTLGFDFNISHDKDFIVGTCAYAKIGIDVMNINNEIKIEIFNSLDKDLLNKIKTSENSQLELIKLWTLIESYFKAIGIGLHFDFNNVIINDNTIQYLHFDKLKYKYIYFENYITCICTI